MPEIELRLTLSEALCAEMEMVRGDMPLAEYLATWLELAHGYAREESIRAHRDKTYQRFMTNTNGYQQAIAAQKITATLGHNVKPFPGNDITRPRSA